MKWRHNEENEKKLFIFETHNRLQCGGSSPLVHLPLLRLWRLLLTKNDKSKPSARFSSREKEHFVSVRWQWLCQRGAVPKAVNETKSISSKISVRTVCQRDCSERGKGRGERGKETFRHSAIGHWYFISFNARTHTSLDVERFFFVCVRFYLSQNYFDLPVVTTRGTLVT